MLTEMHGKGGRLCEQAASGQMRCPLLIRSTSEDVITGELVQVMQTINPRWWLADFLNTALGVKRFQQQVYRRLRIEPWVNHRPYPEELLPWKEGSTQVDIEISWENPPTTVFIEAKYQAELSWKTSNSGGQKKYPGDQLIRNIRVGLHHCGYFQQDALFESAQRDFVVIVLSPHAEHGLVRRYGSEKALRKAIPKSDRLVGLPARPFVGEIGYGQIREVLRRRERFQNRAERALVEDLQRYLAFKKGAAPRQPDSFLQRDRR
jgi:hypothetical protein